MVGGSVVGAGGAGGVVAGAGGCVTAGAEVVGGVVAAAVVEAPGGGGELDVTCSVPHAAVTSATATTPQVLQRRCIRRA